MARRGRDRADEIVRRRISACEFGQIGMDTALPAVLTDIALEHSEHRRALVVGDAVEGVGEVVDILDRLVDLTRRRQFVQVHHIERVAQRVRAEILLRQHRRRSADLGPVGKRLIEPDIVPPRRRDQVAEPLMRQFVRLHRQAGAFLLQRRIGVDQHQPLAEGDGAGVLHRAGGEVGHRQHVQLLKRKPDAEIVLQRRDGARRQRQRIGDARTVAACRDSAHMQRLGAILVRRHPSAIDDVERADRERDQIGRQRLGGLENRVGHAVRRRRGGDDRRVADDLLSSRRDHRDIERRLESRLVERREGAARIGLLELGEGIRVAAVDDLVQALERGIERCVVVEDQRRLAGRHFVDKNQTRHAGRVDLVVMRGKALARFQLDRDAGDREVEAMQEQRTPRFEEFHVDLDMAAEAVGSGIDAKRDAIALRDSDARQPAERNRFAAQ